MADVDFCPKTLTNKRKIYTDWANHYLEKCQKKTLIKDLQKDFQDPSMLVDVIESIAKIVAYFSDVVVRTTPMAEIGEKIPSLKKKQWSREQSIDNINCCIQYLADLGVNLDGVTSRDIKDGQLKSILNLLFSLSRYKQSQKNSTRLPKSTPSNVPSNIIAPKNYHRLSKRTPESLLPTRMTNHATLAHVHFSLQQKYLYFLNQTRADTR
uniref:Calponin-homology (CH) domain-containing protein n=1 Tax=Romanomermis culicivorax TaxID=13658 RepID=A0A915JQW8_ROMCU